MKEILITSSVLILAVVAIRFAFRRTISRRVQYALWGLVLLRLLLPFHLPALAHNVLSAAEDTPAMETARELGDTAVLWRDYEIPQSVPAEPDPTLPREEQQARWRENIAEWEAEQREWSEATGTPVTVGDILRYVWYGGMAVMTVWLLATNLRFYRRLRKARIPYTVDGCKYPVYLCDGLPSPCLFGVLRPAIYLTPAAAETPEHLRFVLAHEQTHARHLDPIWSLLRGACLVAYWFDPLVWLAAYLSKLDCELACDEGTLSRLPPEDRVAYGETLLSLIPVRRGGEDPMLSATTMTAGKRQMRDRITRIAENRRPLGIALFAALALTLGVCAVTFTGAAAPTEPSEPGTMERLVSASEEQGNIILQTNADLDHDGADETVVVYEITAEEPPRAYVVCVYKNGEPLWAEAYNLSHPGWGKLYLCRADGQDWLVRYLPMMYQGYATYRWTQFSLESGRERVEREESVDFNTEDPSSIRNGTMDAFSTRLNALLADSTLLISTVDGTARWGAANEANVDVYGELEMPLPFRGLWGLEEYGWYEDVEVAPHHYTRGYYAYDAAGKPVQLAESFGFNLEDFILDLDGDGVTELVCNCVYGADGAARVNVYRRSGDLIERGTFDPVTLGLADWDDLGGVGSHAEYWDAEAGAFTTGYLTDAGAWRTVRSYGYEGFEWEEYAVLDYAAWGETVAAFEIGSPAWDAATEEPRNDFGVFFDMNRWPKSAVAKYYVDETLPDGTRVVLFDRAGGDGYEKYWAIDLGDAFEIFGAENNGYTTGWGVEAFADVLGYDGFRVHGPRGAGYDFTDYYTFDESGAPRFLASVNNSCTEADIDGDGQRELVSLYHYWGAWLFWARDGKVYRTDLNALVENTGEWTWRDFDLAVSGGIEERIAERGELPVLLADASGNERHAVLRLRADGVDLIVNR